jgi:hypothetical protein
MSAALGAPAGHEAVLGVVEQIRAPVLASLARGAHGLGALGHQGDLAHDVSPNRISGVRLSTLRLTMAVSMALLTDRQVGHDVSDGVVV